MTEPVQWDPKVPLALRRVLQELVEDAHPDDGGPMGVLAELLEVPTPPESGYDAVLWVRREIGRLDANASTALYKLSPGTAARVSTGASTRPWQADASTWR